VRVKFEVRPFAWDAAPKIDVRLIPDFEVPLRNLVDAVTFDQVLGEMRHQSIPGFETFRRRDIRLVPEGVEGVWIEGQLLWHEAYFDHRTDTVLQQAIIDLIDIREIVDGISVLVLVVNTDLVVQDGVEADVFEIGDLLDGDEVVPVAIAQG
jgi:hypothetical protein